MQKLFTVCSDKCLKQKQLLADQIMSEALSQASVTLVCEHVKLFRMLQQSWYDVMLCSVFLKT